jgi:hypothetical protein
MRSSRAQNTTQKSISIAFCVSSIRHDSSLSKYRKQKQSPLWTCAIFSISRGGLFLFTVLAEWRIMTNSVYAKSIGDGLLCSILCFRRQFLNLDKKFLYDYVRVRQATCVMVLRAHFQIFPPRIASGGNTSRIAHISCSAIFLVTF